MATSYDEDDGVHHKLVLAADRGQAQTTATGMLQADDAE